MNEQFNHGGLDEKAASEFCNLCQPVFSSAEQVSCKIWRKKLDEKLQHVKFMNNLIMGGGEKNFAILASQCSPAQRKCCVKM